MAKSVFGAALALALSGCAVGRPSVGWRFEVYQDSQSSVPVLIKSGSGSTTAMPLAASAGPQLDAGTVIVPVAPEMVRTAPKRGRQGPIIVQEGTQTLESSCTLEEACRRLDALERCLPENRGRPFVKMPTGPQ